MSKNNVVEMKQEEVIETEIVKKDEVDEILDEVTKEEPKKEEEKKAEPKKEFWLIRGVKVIGHGIASAGRWVNKTIHRHPVGAVIASAAISATAAVGIDHLVGHLTSDDEDLASMVDDEEIALLPEADEIDDEIDESLNDNNEEDIIDITDEVKIDE